MCAFDKNYYEEKRIKITNQIVKKMEDAIINIGNTLNSFYQDKNQLVADLQEIVKLQKENEENKDEKDEKDEKVKEKIKEEVEKI